MINNELQEYAEIAIQAAEEACREILIIYNSSSTQVELKSDRSPLTLADQRAHEIICSRLLKSQFPILSEEGNENIPYKVRKKWTSYWLVDPLDGTKEFIKKNGEFTVNIALIHKDVPILGVVAVPVTGEVFYGLFGIGAFLSHKGAVRLLRKRDPVKTDDTGLRVVASRSHMNDQTTSFIENLHKPNLVSVGSSLKFMALAKGEADIYPRFVPSMEWDVAASHVIVKELGFEIRNAFNNEVLTYNKTNLLNPSFICQ